MFEKLDAIEKRYEELGEQIAQPHHRPIDAGEGAKLRQILRGDGRGQEQQRKKQRAHGHHRSRDRVESISSLAEMTRLFIS